MDYPNARIFFIRYFCLMEIWGMKKGKMASFVFQRINNVANFERKPTFGCREKERKGKENQNFE